MEALIEDSGGLSGLLAILMIFGIGFLAVSGGLFIGFVKMLRQTRTSRNSESDAEDTKAFQDMQRSFRRMEERIEALETLMIENSKHERFETELR
ncbi:MAG: hypothetical protein AAB353_06185 [Candidatus Hydrogenedentota bacterium]